MKKAGRKPLSKQAYPIMKKSSIKKAIDRGASMAKPKIEKHTDKSQNAHQSRLTTAIIINRLSLKNIIANILAFLYLSSILTPNDILQRNLYKKMDNIVSSRVNLGLALLPSSYTSTPRIFRKKACLHLFL